MKKSSVIWNNIKKQIVIYIAIIVIFPLTMLYFANLRIQTPKDKIFGLYLGFSEESVNGNELSNDLAKFITSKYNIEELNVWRQSPKNQGYDDYTMGYGVYNSDLLILPKNKTSDNFIVSYMCEFKSYNIDTLTIQNVKFGLKLYNSETKNGLFTKYLTYESTDTNYYLFISGESVHYQNYKNNSESLLDDVIKWVISDEQVKR